MEASEYKGLVPNANRPWQAHLSFENRLKFIDYYKEGYAVYKIAKTFQVTAGTVEYHLRVAQVYIPGKKPTKRGIEIQGHFQILQASHGLSKIVIASLPKPKTKIQLMLEEEDEQTRKMQKAFPKNYREYLARAKQRHPIEYNGIYASTVNPWSV